jgi:Flp pilus assembly pilin Flp
MINSILTALWQEEEGQDLVEYSLLLAFIALAAIALLSAAGGSVKSIWTSINTILASAASSNPRASCTREPEPDAA